MKFLYLKNLGSPTRWDAARYFDYRDRQLGGLPSDLRSIVDTDRYMPGAEQTFWHSELLCIDWKLDELRLSLVNGARKHMFEFSYSGLQKVASQSMSVAAAPSLVVQELTVLRDEVYRHAIADLAGRCVVVYSRHMKFSELRRS